MAFFSVFHKHIACIKELLQPKIEIFRVVYNTKILFFRLHFDSWAVGGLQDIPTGSS
jgi:hypothetical protein